MKKKILSQLAQTANELDHMKLHKEANVITKVMLKVAQSDLGDYYPSGASNDPKAPFNQDTRLEDDLDERIDKNFVSAFAQCYRTIANQIHEWSAHEIERALQSQESQKAFDKFDYHVANMFGDRLGVLITEKASEQFYDLATKHKSKESFMANIHEMALNIIDPFYGQINDIMQQYSQHDF
jgi:hypothetical protein